MSAKSILQSLWLPLLLLAIWQISSTNAWINPFFFPPPTKLLATGAAMIASGELAQQLLATLLRYSSGVIIGCIAGLAAGILMGVAASARRAGEPLIAALYSTPKITLLPLVMLLLGIGDASRITLVATVAMIFLSLQTLDAIRGIDKSYIDMARNYRANKTAIVRRVYLPAALPQIFTGLRMALTRSLVTAISLEMISATDGIGALIWMSWQTLATERLFIGILTAAALGIVTHWTLNAAEAVAVPWRR